MRSFTRTIFVWVHLTLFGALALFGEGLHLLPGFGHGCGGHEDAGCRATFDDGHACCAAPHGPAATAADTMWSNGNECPICQFYAQAKVAAVPLSLDGAPQVAADAVVAWPSLRPAQRLRPYDPRGPPVAGALA